MPDVRRPERRIVRVCAGMAAAAGLIALWFISDSKFAVAGIGCLVAFAAYAFGTSAKLRVNATETRDVLRLEQLVGERTKELRDSEQKFRAIFHSQFHFIGVLALDGRILEANRTALAVAGVTADQVIGKPFWETAWWVHDEAVRQRLRESVSRAAAGEQIRFQTQFATGAGTLRWADFSLTPFRDGEGRICFLIPEGHDITEAIHIQQELRIEEERFRSAFDCAPIGMALVAPDGRWLRVNRVICELVGYSEAELLVTDFQTITHPEDLDLDLGFVRQMLAGTIASYQMEKRYFHKSGRIVHIMLSVSLVREADGSPRYFVSQIRDITERKLADSRMLASLHEKEVLLKEIHHRVKNNLQIVSTLLDLQSDHTQDPQALEMFQESRGRVRSMALIHERLYRSEDLSRVDFVHYVRQLADDLFRTYRVSDQNVELEVNVDVPPLPIDIAIPCGLLLNELISNCL